MGRQIHGVLRILLSVISPRSPFIVQLPVGAPGLVPITPLWSGIPDVRRSPSPASTAHAINAKARNSRRCHQAALEWPSKCESGRTAHATSPYQFWSAAANCTRSPLHGQWPETTLKQRLSEQSGAQSPDRRQHGGPRIAEPAERNGGQEHLHYRDMSVYRSVLTDAVCMEAKRWGGA